MIRSSIKAHKTVPEFHMSRTNQTNGQKVYFGFRNIEEFRRMKNLKESKRVCEREKERERTRDRE